MDAAKPILHLTLVVLSVLRGSGVKFAGAPSAIRGQVPGQD